ncbi:pancreatic triacylglycerol lipase-like [Ochlerotatus camptorhynchus]|uniref:pancreatic triacylglycerol lipase-like n=1 Tax=Ochlerotatus camptorhynchus TaxID=644619 RepID=UPI0031D0F5D0
MKLEVSILCALALLATTVNAKYLINFVRDAKGDMRLVNPNPYSVIDTHLEPFFNAETDTVFRLYTRKNPKEGQILKPNETSSVNSSNFNPQHQTRFLVHGWIQDGNSEMQSLIRNSYLAIGDFNVINVDWGMGAQTINYITARYRVASVGLVISNMIDTLVNGAGISLDTIYVIGHSLGGHVAGVVGKHQNGRINSIIGLDPAGPLFSADNDDVLSEKDAQYVETVFTNAGQLGFYGSLGGANFYANGGSSQPGCGFDLFGSCAHARAWSYFAESVTSSVGFRATRCQSHDDLAAGQCVSSSSDGVTMGGEPSNHGKGVEGFYLICTNSEEPYAKG